MQINSFKNKLDVVSLAVSTKEIVAQFSHILFKDGNMTAHNDSISIRTPCAVGFNGAVRGKLLEQFINKSSGAEVEFIPQGEDKVKVVVGGSSMVFPCLDPDRYSFPFPDFSLATGKTDLTDSFFLALEHNLLAVSKNPHHPEYMGVVASWDSNKNLSMVSTDDSVLCKTVVNGGAVSPVSGERFIIPSEFAHTINGIKKSYPDDTATMFFDKDVGYLGVEIGEFQIMSKLLGVRIPETEGIFDSRYEELLSSPSLSLTDEFWSAIDRSSIIGNSPVCEISFVDGSLQLITMDDGKQNVVKDVIKVDGGFSLSSPIKVDTKAIQKAQGLFSRAWFSEDTTLFGGPLKTGDEVFIGLIVANK